MINALTNSVPTINCDPLSSKEILGNVLPKPLNFEVPIRLLVVLRKMESCSAIRKFPYEEIQAFSLTLSSIKHSFNFSKEVKKKIL